MIIHSIKIYQKRKSIFPKNFFVPHKKMTCFQFTWSHSSRSLKKKFESATLKIRSSIFCPRWWRRLPSFTYLNKIRLNIEQQYQMIMRYIWHCKKLIQTQSWWRVYLLLSWWGFQPFCSKNSIKYSVQTHLWSILYKTKFFSFVSPN